MKNKTPTPAGDFRHKSSIEGFFDCIRHAIHPRFGAPIDPFWRRLLIGLGLYLQCWADRWFPGRPCIYGITGEDRARWRVEGIGQWIFDRGHAGSQAEHEMILAGDLELSGLSWEHREKYLPLLEPFVIADDLRSSIVRFGNEVLELDDHPGFDALDEDAADSIRIQLANARSLLMDAAHALTRELTVDASPAPLLLLEDRRAA